MPYHGRGTSPRGVTLNTRLFALLACLLPAVSAAQAARCPERSDHSLITPAQLLVATVTSVEARPDPRVKGWGELSATVQVDEVLRGPEMPARRTVRGPMVGGRSAHGLQSGAQLVLFVQDDGSLGLCGGTRLLPPPGSARDALLAKMRGWAIARTTPARYLFAGRAWAQGEEPALLALLPQLAEEELLGAARLLVERDHEPAEPALAALLQQAPLRRSYASLGNLAGPLLRNASQSLVDAVASRVSAASGLPPSPQEAVKFGRLLGADLARMQLGEANQDLKQAIEALRYAPASTHVRLAAAPGAFAPEHRQLVEALLRHRGELEARFARLDPDNFVHFAARAGPRDLSALLARGADVHWRSREGDTALLAAVRSGNRPNARLLLQAGANPNAADPEGKTALHLLAGEGFAWKQGLGDASLAMARSLFAHGARPSPADRRGWTPLHVAAAQQFEGMAELLADAGADLDAEGVDGNGLAGLRPLQLAEDSSSATLAAMLQARGASTSAAYGVKRAAHRAAVKVLGPLLRGH